MIKADNNKLSYRDMINIVEELSQRSICLSCGEDIYFLNGKCSNCGKQFENVQYVSKYINEILYSIRDKTLELDELTIALYAIKDRIPEVNEILKKNNIEEKLHKKLNDINQSLANGEVLKQDDDLFLKTCLSNNIKPKDGLNDIAIFRNIFSHDKDKIVSYETFKQVIKSFIKDTMREINGNRINNYNPVCFVYDFKATNNENSDGISNKHFIMKINDKIIEDMYNNYSVLDFVTIFHELAHIQQNIDIKLGCFTEDILNFIKDDILRDLCHREGFDYYKENYQVITSEKDAEIKGYVFAINFLEQVLNIKLKDEILTDLDKKISVQLEQKSNLLRKTNNGEQDINSLFDYYIKNHPEFLEKYPQLSVEYIVSDGIVRRKTNDELMETLTLYQEQPVIVLYINQILSSQMKLNNGITSHK